MGMKLTATELKSRILAVLDDVEAGEEIEITRHGRTIARLVPAASPHALKGSCTGIAISVGDEDALFSTGATWDLT
jgi:prevent-host-death family protein